MFNWSQIAAGDTDFDRRELQIAAMEKVTTEQVNALAKEVFFVSPRRINIKILCHKHRDNEELLKTNAELNKAFYER